MEIVETVAIILISLIVAIVIWGLLVHSGDIAKGSQDVVEMKKICDLLCEKDSFGVGEVYVEQSKCGYGLAPNFCSKNCTMYTSCVLTDRRGRSCGVGAYTCYGEEI